MNKFLFLAYLASADEFEVSHSDGGNFDSTKYNMQTEWKGKPVVKASFKVPKHLEFSTRLSTEDELEENMKNFPMNLVIGYFDNWELPDGQAFLKAASRMREECTLTSSKYGPFEFRHTMHNISEEFRQEFGEGIQIRRKKLESEEYTDADILHYPGGEYTIESVVEWVNEVFETEITGFMHLPPGHDEL